MVSNTLRTVTSADRSTTLGDSHGDRGGEHDGEENMLGSVRHDPPDMVMNMAVHTPNLLGPGPPQLGGVPQPDPDPAREIDHVARVSKESDTDRDSSVDQEHSVRLSVNLSIESAETLRALIRRKGLTITEGIRRAIAVWKFVEDENSKGNQIAVIEHDGSIRKVVLL